MNQAILDEMDKRDIHYRFNEEISKVVGNAVHFESGKVENYDLIIEGVGVKPNSEFIKIQTLL